MILFGVYKCSMTVGQLFRGDHLVNAWADIYSVLACIIGFDLMHFNLKLSIHHLLRFDL
jgi:hypothetical protein